VVLWFCLKIKVIVDMGIVMSSEMIRVSLGKRRGKLAESFLSKDGGK
jgi:hypothetical protein